MSQPAPSFDEICSILKERSLSQKKTGWQMQETEWLMQLAIQAVEKTSQVVKKAIQVDQKTSQAFEKAIQVDQKTSQAFEKASQESCQLKDLFSNKWGELVESLVSGCLFKFLIIIGMFLYGLFAGAESQKLVKVNKEKPDASLIVSKQIPKPLKAEEKAKKKTITEKVTKKTADSTKEEKTAKKTLNNHRWI